MGDSMFDLIGRLAREQHLWPRFILIPPAHGKSETNARWWQQMLADLERVKVWLHGPSEMQQAASWRPTMANVAAIWPKPWLYPGDPAGFTSLMADYGVRVLPPVTHQKAPFRLTCGSGARRRLDW